LSGGEKEKLPKPQKEVGVMFIGKPPKEPLGNRYAKIFVMG